MSDKVTHKDVKLTDDRAYNLFYKYDPDIAKFVMKKYYVWKRFYYRNGVEEEDYIDIITENKKLRCNHNNDFYIKDGKIEAGTTPSYLDDKHGAGKRLGILDAAEICLEQGMDIKSFRKFIDVSGFFVNRKTREVYIREYFPNDHGGRSFEVDKLKKVKGFYWI